MMAYLLNNWCGTGPRIIVHPKGLPPSWLDSNLPEDVQQRAVSAAYECCGRPIPDGPVLWIARLRSPNCPLHTYHKDMVFHLNPKTLELIEAFDCQ